MVDLNTTILGISVVNFLAFIAVVFHFARKVGGIEVKVDTMWAFQMRRTMSDVVQSGLGTVNSPFRFNDEVQHALAPMKPDLIAFWATLPLDITDAAALLKIEAEFGERILRLVGMPFALTHDACLLLALTVAKQSNTIELTPGVPIKIELAPPKEASSA